MNLKNHMKIIYQLPLYFFFPLYFFPSHFLSNCLETKHSLKVLLPYTLVIYFYLPFYLDMISFSMKSITLRNNFLMHESYIFKKQLPTILIEVITLKHNFHVIKYGKLFKFTNNLF